MQSYANVLALCASCALAGGTAGASAQEEFCEVEVTPLTPPVGGPTLPNTAPWVQRFQDASTASPQVLIDPKIPFADRLRTFPLAGTKQPGIWINALIKEPGQEDQRKDVYLPNPVLVVTWVGSHRNFDPCPLPGQECAVNFQDFEMFQEYRANRNDGNLNMWFATTCNASEYLKDVLQVELGCMNPDLGVDGCYQAITLGLPSVGVPYAFGPMTNSEGTWDPYGAGVGGDVFNLWWQSDLMVAVADRSALIRPSLNPTVAPDSPQRPTADGKPVWNGSTYRQPEPIDAIYPAVMEKLDGSADPDGPKEFVGYINQCPEDGGLPMEFRGAEGYWKWLEFWRMNSWYGPHQPDQSEPPGPGQLCGSTPANRPYNLFPFSGLGLTLYWNLPLQGIEPLPREFYAVSEFIHVGEQPIYVVGVYQGAQMLGGGLPGSGQVPWYESCNSDLNMDGIVNGRDLAILLAQWNTDPASPTNRPNMCVNRDKLQAAVGAGALLELLNDWGPCTPWPLQDLDPACR